MRIFLICDQLAHRLRKAAASAILPLVSDGRTLDSLMRDLGQLTDREFEVFQLMGEGLAAREIGGRLHIKDKLELKTLP